MSWQDILGQDQAIEMFRRAVAKGRLASTFLLVGPAGVGKRLVAERLAQALLCQNKEETSLEACGNCPSCTQVMSGSHPDLLRVKKPVDKAVIPVELLIGTKEHRMREGLCYDISLRPFVGKRRIAILDDADYLNQEGANALLKTLEEPPAGSVLMLLGTSLQRQLPTIRSRCQIVPFRPLSEAVLSKILLQQQWVMDAESAAKVAALSDGSLEQAQGALAPGFSEYRTQLLECLAEGEFDQAALVKATTQFVDGGGKDGAQKRLRLRQAMGIAIAFYRQVLWMQASPDAGSEVGAGDEELKRTATRALRWYTAGAEEAIDSCLLAMSHLDANANQATLVEWWLDDLMQKSVAASPPR